MKPSRVIALMFATAAISALITRLALRGGKNDAEALAREVPPTPASGKGSVDPPRVSTILYIPHWEVASNGLVVDACVRLGPIARADVPFEGHPEGVLLRSIAYSQETTWEFTFVGASSGLSVVASGNSTPIGMGGSAQVNGSTDPKRPQPCMLTWLARPKTGDWFSVEKEDDVIWEVTVN